MIAGAVGSIDNDMVGTDKTIGADSAMHRIIEAVDALSSTAASHQRSFVVEVMGRHCGYLTVMCAIAGGADYILIPEVRPGPGWEDRLIARLAAGRAAGRRDNLVLVAEGVTDSHGVPITAQMVADLITTRAGEDTRVTILGHVQRGGTPSAYDRWMPTLMGHAAANDVLDAGPDHVSALIGIRGNRVDRMPLMDAVAATQAIPGLIEADDQDAAMAARGVVVHRDGAGLRGHRAARADVPQPGHDDRDRPRRWARPGHERRRARGCALRDLPRATTWSASAAASPASWPTGSSPWAGRPWSSWAALGGAELGTSRRTTRA